MTRCPTAAEIDAVLAHAAAAATSAATRAHVASCEACLERHGAGFELELWGAALPEAARAPASPAPRALASPARLAAAACVLLVAGAAAWWVTRTRTPAVARERSSAVRVFELVTDVGTSGPDGTVDQITTFRASDPLVLQIQERRRDREGCVETHDRRLALADARPP